jgi:hypothetical protein
MSDGLQVSRPRWYLVRDPQGRILFVPWHPFSRAAYVVPTPLQRTDLERRIRSRVLWSVAAVLVATILLGVLDWPAWWSLVPPIVLVADWYWWSGRAARGMERTRYEPQPPR